MKSVFLGAVAIACSTVVCAQTVEQPTIKAGDTWLYRLTAEKAPQGWIQTRSEFTVERVTASIVYFNVKQVGSTLPPNEVYMGRDWSVLRNVNGKETVVNRPFAFPMMPGKTWEVGYDEKQPNHQFKSERRSRKFNVLGYETIEVPAGKFNALKIEAEGQWVAELAPGQNVVQSAKTSENGSALMTQVQNTAADTKVTGRTYSVLWYAPEVKRWVKSIEEEYGSAGSRSARYTAELESFKVGD